MASCSQRNMVAIQVMTVSVEKGVRPSAALRERRSRSWRRGSRTRLEKPTRGAATATRRLALRRVASAFSAARSGTKNASSWLLCLVRVLRVVFCRTRASSALLAVQAEAVAARLAEASRRNASMAGGTDDGRGSSVNRATEYIAWTSSLVEQSSPNAASNSLLGNGGRALRGSKVAAAVNVDAFATSASVANAVDLTTSASFPDRASFFPRPWSKSKSKSSKFPWSKSSSKSSSRTVR
mmetsp:Transcript_5116/g.16748  ORF Transcript_5116/g.16748 Transcript_5116/m.16748 type:complete len:239 (+) Transcript_5116:256-972(+)